MRSNDWLNQATKKLQSNGIGTARLDALVLLEDVIGTDRGRLLAEPERELTTAQADKLEKLLKWRAQHEPLAYVRGKTEFYGREFMITPAVLEPRPESETMIELLKQLAKAGKLPTRNRNLLKIADVGAGSGALGITAKLEFSGIYEVAIDLLEIDPKAAAVAKTNVDKFTMNARIILSDLLENAKRDYDILLCNLPYVPDNYLVNEAAQHEPRIALFGGPDGLDLYRRLFDQVALLAVQPLYILTESLPAQHTTLEVIASEQNYLLAITDDFIQVFRPGPRQV